MRLSRIYLWIVAVDVAAGIVLLLNEWLRMMYVRSDESWYAILALTLGYAIVGLGCAAAYENGRMRGLMPSGMIVGLIAWGGWVIVALRPSLWPGMTSLRAFIWPTNWACLMMLVGVLSLLPMREGWRRWIRGAAICMLGALALFIAGACAFYPEYDPRRWNEDQWQQVREYEQAAFQIGGALTFLTAGCLVCTLIIGVMSAVTDRGSLRAHAARGDSNRLAYWLRCPRCGREQQAKTGEHLCEACGLRVKVELA